MTDQKAGIPDVGRSRRQRLADYFWLYLARGLVLITGLLVFRWANTILGSSSFAEYALARRTISLLAPALVLGLGVGLPRKVAMLSGQQEGGTPLDYFWSGLMIILGSNAVLLAASVVAPGYLGLTFFGDREHGGLVVPIAINLTGLSLHNLIWAYLRGRFHFRAASILEILNLVAIPVASFLVFHDSTAQLLQAIGLLTAGSCLITVVGLGARRRPSRWGHWSRGRDLLSYGFPRVPGDFALAGLIGIPSLIAAHLFGLQTGGYVAFAATMLSLAGTAVAPLGTALLPEASRLISMGRRDELRRGLIRICTVTAAGAVVLLVVVEIWLPLILRIYLGEGFEAAVPVMRVFALGTLPYVLFSVLRNVVDAAYHRPVNTINIVLSLVVFLALAAVIRMLGMGIGGILGAAVAAHGLLFALTLRVVLRVFRPSEGGADAGGS